MKIYKDNRQPELKRIEALLYGYNYQVSLNLYGPLDPSLGLEPVLADNVSKDSKVTNIVRTSPDDVKRIIIDNLFYEGDVGSGPIDLQDKKDELLTLIDIVFSSVHLNEADSVVNFVFSEGHPAYPVFWDFAYDIHSQNERWIFVGCSSD